MNRRPLSFALALAAAMPAGAALSQGVVQGPPAVVYDQRNDPAYQRQVEDHEDAQARYQAGRETYLIQQDRYRRDRADYLRARAEYDARYGPGAYDRYRIDWYRPYANSPCERAARASQATGGVIGALAGAAIGSNIAASGVRAEGAVLGALVGGALGANVGRASAYYDGVTDFRYVRVCPDRRGRYRITR